MILELDVGNSRIKWRRIEADHGAVLTEGVAADLDELIAGPVSSERPAMLRFCSVRDEEIANKLKQWAAVSFGLEARQARVQRQCAGVSNSYQDLGRLGVDRWLAMLAAYNRKQQACLIVDSGTALTIDAVDSAGQHLGGYILPGWQLMAGALEANTRIRLQHRQEPENLELGHGTEAAVLNGAVAALVSLVEKVQRQVRQEAEPVTLYLAGGDAQLLAGALNSEQVELVSGLVMDGLAYACPAIDQ
jgi:type III pantothenate kinase